MCLLSATLTVTEALSHLASYHRIVDSESSKMATTVKNPLVPPFFFSEFEEKFEMGTAGGIEMLTADWCVCLCVDSLP
jgi:hypothetical protein